MPEPKLVFRGVIPPALQSPLMAGAVALARTIKEAVIAFEKEYSVKVTDIDVTLNPAEAKVVSVTIDQDEDNVCCTGGC